MKCHYCDNEATSRAYNPICKRHFEIFFEDTLNGIEKDGVIEISQDGQNIKLTEKGRELCKSLFGEKKGNGNGGINEG